MKGEHTEICSCTVLELAAIDRAIRVDHQYELLLGKARWTARGRGLLERLRSIRGLNVIENHQAGGVFVTIAGSLRPDGFTKVINQNTRDVSPSTRRPTC